MANVTITFKKKFMFFRSLRLVINNAAPIVIPNGSTITLDLPEGTHTIQTCVPHKNADTYSADTQIEIKPSAMYEVVYHVPELSLSGMITITEIPFGAYLVDANGNHVKDKSKINITKTKYRLNAAPLIATILACALACYGILLTAKASHLFDPSTSAPGINASSGIQYDKGPLTLTKSHEGDVLYAKVDVESFEILSRKHSYADRDEIHCEIKGVVNGSSSLKITLKCYDAEGLLVGTGFLRLTSVTGETFKLKKSTYIPQKTVRIVCEAG